MATVARVIHCEVCGSPRLTKAKNTKYCEVCSTLRNLEYISTKKQVCPACDSAFLPSRRNEGVCGKCNNFPVPGNPRGACALCGAEDSAYMAPHISVCRPCSTDPERRSVLIKALVEKQRKLISGEISLPEVVPAA